MRALLVSTVAAAALAACPDDSPPGPIGDVDADAATAPTDSDISVIPPVSCVEATDCEGEGVAPVCRVADCVDGACVFVASPDGAPCDDGSACTTDDRCEAGACGGVDACDDGNPCTTDGCDPASGCVHTFNQRPCDDGDPCTTGDACSGGDCVGLAVDCDDRNPCTDDRCDPVDGCVSTPRAGACDDGDACTVGDVCVDGACQPGADAVCGDPDNPCVAGSCDPVTGCAVTIVSGPCDDDDACTVDDICVEGVCAGQLITCDDDNPCTDDYCSSTAGCLTTNNVLACDDGDPCTVGDTCGGGACLPGSPNPLCCEVDAGCDDGDPCTLDRCDDGLCASTPVDCDDGAACTLDRCDGGLCSNTPWGSISSAPEIVADFEEVGALSAWELASTNALVYWQRDTSQFRSGAASLYCGATPQYTYDLGATFATAARAIAIAPGAQATLRLWVRADLEENTSCTYDVVRIAVDGVEVATVCASQPTFTELVADLTPWVGQVVQLTLSFDTLDDQANDGAGVWVDDITVTVDGAPPCCLVDGDCPDAGASCTSEVCGADFACAVPDEAVACDDGDPCTADSCLPAGDCEHAAIPGCVP